MYLFMCTAAAVPWLRSVVGVVKTPGWAMLPYQYAQRWCRIYYARQYAFGGLRNTSGRPSIGARLTSDHWKAGIDSPRAADAWGRKARRCFVRAQRCLDTFESGFPVRRLDTGDGDNSNPWVKKMPTSVVATTRVDQSEQGPSSSRHDVSKFFDRPLSRTKVATILNLSVAANRSSPPREQSPEKHFRSGNGETAKFQLLELGELGDWAGVRGHGVLNTRPAGKRVSSEPLLHALRKYWYPGDTPHMSTTRNCLMRPWLVSVTKTMITIGHRNADVAVVLVCLAFSSDEQKNLAAAAYGVRVVAFWHEGQPPAAGRQAVAH
ncbi:predicted protein [Histoplasma capsulatum var. duboisii H88]|uniref:Predicted protein n=1 Tax=Ajellomyces capsulatus (strain H88) TaxID=544711 RepID=F0UHN6_AJEC8|nr:predicted protein [Histoplasma capsulatum var. duboisii H88]